jgi:hypothetical protein
LSTEIESDLGSRVIDIADSGAEQIQNLGIIETGTPSKPLLRRQIKRRRQ